MKIKFVKYCFITFLMLFAFAVQAQKFKTTTKGILDGWSTFNFNEKVDCQFGVRFIPTINIEKSLNEKLKFDFEGSFNSTTFWFYKDWEFQDNFDNIRPYRLWARLSSNQFELRVGLQKINFGTASILRPLMWFDQVDPRDPLQLTTGVNGILGRYYFKNNANIWIWTLYGNDNIKGWEVIESEKDKPEIGGRIQFPIPKGEAGVSIHHRTANLNSFILDSTEHRMFPENKIGIDGKWDLGVGLWFELVVKKNEITKIPRPMLYEHSFTLGLDYTFGLGNGLNVLTEFFYLSQSDNLFASDKFAKFSSFSINYPLDLMNNISTIVFYNWNDQSLYRFINFQRTYDYWSFYLMAFWNPESFKLFNYNAEQNLFAGKGLQLMAVYNF
ncbi:MAG: hypothetical protein U9R42_12550 [Bacteroidota bacterium]|nr:hypothetical protein [Bacteroidota bacterium]